MTNTRCCDLTFEGADGTLPFTTTSSIGWGERGTGRGRRFVGAEQRRATPLWSRWLPRFSSLMPRQEAIWNSSAGKSVCWGHPLYTFVGDANVNIVVLGPKLLQSQAPCEL